MTNMRPGPPQWPLSISTQNQASRPPYAPASDRTTAPPNVPPGRHSDPRTRHNAGPRHATGEWRTVPGPRGAAAPPESARRRTGRLDKSRWHWLLLIPIVVPLVPAIYNRIEPTLMGLPFFYWGQLSFAFLASAVIAFVHRKVK